MLQNTSLLLNFFFAEVPLWGHGPILFFSLSFCLVFCTNQKCFFIPFTENSSWQLITLLQIIYPFQLSFLAYHLDFPSLSSIPHISTSKTFTRWISRGGKIDFRKEMRKWFKFNGRKSVSWPHGKTSLDLLFHMFPFREELQSSSIWPSSVKKQGHDLLYSLLFIRVTNYWLDVKCRTTRVSLRTTRFWQPRFDCSKDFSHLCQ